MSDETVRELCERYFDLLRKLEQEPSRPVAWIVRTDEMVDVAAFRVKEKIALAEGRSVWICEAVRL